MSMNESLQFATTAFKPPRQYNWQPQSDITAYELALCLPVLTATGYGAGEQIDNLPDAARRHFVEVK